MKKYYEEGEIFQYHLDIIKVVKAGFDRDEKCKSCEYNRGFCGTELACTVGSRYDGKSVIYAKIDELEEGEEFKEENYAK